ncbi:MAG TPA: hypothetical protein VHC50_04655, partial [Puia sp.]|nr:hypothetical protein [Puia sp.]
MSVRSLTLYILVFLCSGCGSSGKQNTKTASDAAAIEDTVPVFILKTDTLKKMVELPGELLPYEQTDLYAKISGFV